MNLKGSGCDEESPQLQTVSANLGNQKGLSSHLKKNVRLRTNVKALKSA